VRFLFLEPFFSGSHRDFAEGLAAHSAHDLELVTLPGRFWKWRMRGAALAFLRKIPDLRDFDGLLVTDLMSLTDFKALAGPACPPTMVYFHENQVDYPLGPGGVVDYQFGFTDITTCLAADRIAFNSDAHRAAFLNRLPEFIRMMPDLRPKWAVAEIRRRSEVLHPGCRFPAGGPPRADFLPAAVPPLVIWNHRWEHDKAPDAFADALEAVDGRGIPFRIALVGERYRNAPPAFERIRERFGKRVVRYGFLKDREAYRKLLLRGDVAVSTARQENFGIAVVEAMRSGCLPLLPNRLSYPELLPPEARDFCLYDEPAELVERLAAALSDMGRFAELRERVSRHMGRFAWAVRAPDFDAALTSLVERGRNPLRFSFEKKCSGHLFSQN
jgi:glycosyltransferase involved in cell wall biosynthesis